MSPSITPGLIPRILRGPFPRWSGMGRWASQFLTLNLMTSKRGKNYKKEAGSKTHALHLFIPIRRLLQCIYSRLYFPYTLFNMYQEWKGDGGEANTRVCSQASRCEQLGLDLAGMGLRIIHFRDKRREPLPTSSAWTWDCCRADIGEKSAASHRRGVHLELPGEQQVCSRSPTGPFLPHWYLFYCGRCNPVHLLSL